MVDYKTLVNNIRPELVVEMMKNLGVTRYIERDNFIVFPTVCHNVDPEEASLKLYFYKNSKQFVCYTHDGAMTIFKFLQKFFEVRGISFDWYGDIVRRVIACAGGDPTNDIVLPNTVPRTRLKERYGTKKNVKELKIYPEYVLGVFTKLYPPEWIEDNISQSVMDKYEILFSISQNKIIIPHRNSTGALVGIRGRALDKWEAENVGKYMPVQIEETWYSHPLGLNLYGLNYNKDNIRRAGIAYVFEGEKSLMQLETAGLPALGVAVCGSSFNKFQMDLLMKNARPREVVLCFDKEEKKGETEYYNKLHRMMSRYKNLAKVSFIYDRNDLLNMKESPIDRGAEVFRELLKRRITIK